MTQSAIEIRSDVMLGKPVIRGTRLTVEQILRDCALGMTADEIADQYPRVTPQDVRAALSFAADYLGREVVVAAE